MENAELRHYIDTQLAAGTSPDELKRLLVHHGWTAALIDEHLSRPAKSLVAFDLANEKSLFNENLAKRKWGIVFLCLPTILIVLVLIGYAVSQFAIANLMTGATLVGSAAGATATGLGVRDTRETVASIVNVALSLIGMLAMLSSLVFIPLGFVFIYKSRRILKDGVPYDERSGKGEASIVPPELGRWNWGAAFLGIIWGVYYRVWIAFLVFVPFVNWVWWIIMGVNGNQWAWQNNKWLSVEYFQRTQKKWTAWAIIMIALGVLSFILSMGVAWSAVSLLGKGARDYQTVQSSDPSQGLSDYGKDAGAPLGNTAMNATYNINGQPVTLKNGTSVVSAADSSALVMTNYFGASANGDLNGDGSDDMAFIIWQQTGGSGTFYYLAAALAAPNEGAPATDTVLLGDRIKPVSTEISNGVIAVTYLDRRLDEPMTAAPSMTVTRNFKIVNGELSEIK